MERGGGQGLLEARLPGLLTDVFSKFYYIKPQKIIRENLEIGSSFFFGTATSGQGQAGQG